MHSHPTDPLLVFAHTEVHEPLTFGQYAATGHAPREHWLKGVDQHQHRVDARLWLDEVPDRLVLEPVLVEVDPTEVTLVIHQADGGRHLEVRAHLEVGAQIVLSEGRGLRESDISSVELRSVRP
jgi:hypothetical protein